MKSAILFVCLTLVALTVAAVSIPLPIVSSGRSVTSTLNSNLISYWKLDEASGTRVDSEPTGTPQDLSDNATVNQTNGIIGSAAWFISGNNEYLNRSDSADLSLGDIDFTFAGWLWPYTTNSSQYVLSKYSTAGNFEYRINVNASGLLTVRLSGDGSAVSDFNFTTAGGIPTNGWTFFAIVHDATGNTVKRSINAGTQDSTAHTTGVFDGNSQFSVGSLNGATGGAFFNGRIDEIGLWKKALTPSEITELYNAGSGKTCCPF